MAEKTYTPAEQLIIDQVKDRMRGGPQKKMQDFAREIGVEYDELIERARLYIKTGEYWSEGGKFEGVGIPDHFWDWYELITGEVVPADSKDWGFFSCSC